MNRYEDYRAATSQDLINTLDMDGVGGTLAGGSTGGEMLGKVARSVYLTSWQAAALAVSGPGRLQRLPNAESAVVTVPDFLNYARLLNTGQAGALIRLPGHLGAAFRAGTVAGFSAMRSPLRLMRMDFWVIAETLLAYDLALLPRPFPGIIMLHGYLADFAFLFERRDFVTRFARKAGPRFGIATQQAPLALSSLARWGLAPEFVSMLYRPGSPTLSSLLQSARQSSSFRNTKFCAEVESFPASPGLPDELASEPALDAYLTRSSEK